MSVGDGYFQMKDFGNFMRFLAILPRRKDQLPKYCWRIFSFENFL